MDESNPHESPKVDATTLDAGIPSQRSKLGELMMLNDFFKIRGWAVMVLVALPLLDTLSVLAAMAPSYSSLILCLGLVGFIFGAGLGAFVSVKVKRQVWWSSCRWAIYGLLGYCILAFTLFGVVLRRQ